jgi:hypothetical protein
MIDVLNAAKTRYSPIQYLGRTVRWEQLINKVLEMPLALTDLALWNNCLAAWWE